MNCYSISVCCFVPKNVDCLFPKFRNRIYRQHNVYIGDARGYLYIILYIKIFTMSEKYLMV